MLRITVVLAASAALVQGSAPPYVQSQEAFTHTKKYLSEALTFTTKDFSDPQSRTHYGYGILAHVIAACVTADRNSDDYNALLVLDKEVPYAWKNYKLIAFKAFQLLMEAFTKVSVMQQLIDVVCDGDDVVECNNKVHAQVQNNTKEYKLSAELLILLGKASVYLRRLEPVLDTVAQGRTEIPYLINYLQTADAQVLIQDLDNAYKKIQQINYRLVWNGSGFDLFRNW